MSRSSAEPGQRSTTDHACDSHAAADTATTRIRELLHRRELAATRHRLAVRRRLALDEAEMLALAHLALNGQLIPAQLQHALGYSSSGIDAVVRRLERDGHITRHTNPADGRSRLVRLTPGVAQAATAAVAPLVTATDQLIATRTDGERRIIETFLVELLQITEDHARPRLEPPPDVDRTAVRIPALWA